MLHDLTNQIMISFFRKFRNKLPENNFKKYSTYAIEEIVLSSIKYLIRELVIKQPQALNNKISFQVYFCNWIFLIYFFCVYLRYGEKYEDDERFL